MTLQEQWEQYRRETCEWCAKDYGELDWDVLVRGTLGWHIGCVPKSEKCAALPYPDWLEGWVGELERRLSEYGGQRCTAVCPPSSHDIEVAHWCLRAQGHDGPHIHACCIVDAAPPEPEQA